MKRGRFTDKEEFIQKHPELKNSLQYLPDEGYFSYSKKENVVTYHLDLGLTATTSSDDCHHLLKTVRDMLQHLEGVLANAKRNIPMGILG